MVNPNASTQGFESFCVLHIVALILKMYNGAASISLTCCYIIRIKKGNISLWYSDVQMASVVNVNMLVSLILFVFIYFFQMNGVAVLERLSDATGGA